MKRGTLRSIELERGICRTPRGEVGGQCLILIKRARLIVFGNPVCHGRYAEGSLWHRLTYGPACCLPIQTPAPPPQHMLSAVGQVPRALFARGAGLLLLFSQPPSPQTGFLIFRPAWAFERGPIIQRGLKREMERGGELVRRERRR